MQTRVRDLALPSVAAVIGGLLLLLAGTPTVAFTDYEVEAEPALMALRAGDVAEFLSRLPAYGGSLILRIPFILAPGSWSGGDLATYRAAAVPCIVAGAALAVFLYGRSRAAGGRRVAAWSVLALCAVNPITLRALEIGHPEELLGAVLCVAAALAAGVQRPLLAGLLLGLAMANKPWAVIVVLPVVLMLDRHRWQALWVAGGVTVTVLAPMLLGGAFNATLQATDAGEIFQPWQAWWFFGEHGEAVRGLYAEKPGYRVAPDWVGAISHPVVVLVPALLALACWRRVRSAPWHDGLLLLATVLLLRGILDTWNISYYEVPFLLALLAWEVHARRGVPVLTAIATVLVWVSFEMLPRALVSPDVQSLFFMAWSVPLALGMVWRVYSPQTFRRAFERVGPVVAPALPTLLGPSSSRPAVPRTASR